MNLKVSFREWNANVKCGVVDWPTAAVLVISLLLQTEAVTLFLSCDCDKIPRPFINKRKGILADGSRGRGHNSGGGVVASSGNGKLSPDIFSCQQEAGKWNGKWGKTIKTAPRGLSAARLSPQMVPLKQGQVFKYMSLWETFLIKTTIETFACCPQDSPVLCLATPPLPE